MASWMDLNVRFITKIASSSFNAFLERFWKSSLKALNDYIFFTL